MTLGFCYFFMVVILRFVSKYITMERSYNFCVSKVNKAKKVATTPPIQFNVSPTPSSFAGRTSQLAELHKRLTNNAEVAEPVVDALEYHSHIPIVNVTGLGGIGKSELVRKYIQVYGKYYDKGVIWISAHTEKGLLQKFHSLADNLEVKVSESVSSSENLFSKVYTHFRTGKCLFVFDDIADFAQLDKFLPIPTEFGGECSLHFILISREPGETFKKNVMQIPALTHQEGVILVGNVIGQEEEVVQQQDTVRLLNHLQRHPLAIHLASVYIQQERRRLSSSVTFPVSQYLKQFCDKENDSISFFNWSCCTLDFNDCHYALVTCWQVTLDRVRQVQFGEVALKMLEYMSMMRLEEADRVGVFLKQVFVEEELVQGGQLLANYGLMTAQTGNQVCQWRLQPLIVDIVRITLVKEGREEQILEEINKMVENSSGFINTGSKASPKSDVTWKGFSGTIDFLYRRLLESENVQKNGLDLSAIHKELWRKRDCWTENKNNVSISFLILRSNQSPLILQLLDAMLELPECQCDNKMLTPVLLAKCLWHFQACGVSKSLELLALVCDILLVENGSGATEDKGSPLGIKDLWGVRWALSCLLALKSDALIMRVVSRLGRYLVRDVLSPDSDPLDFELIGIFGSTLSLFGYHSNAIRLQSLVFNRHRQVSPSDSMHSLLRLADACRRSKNLEMSATLYASVYSKSRKSFGENCDLCFEAQLGLSEVLLVQRKYNAGLSLLSNLVEELTNKFVELRGSYYAQLANICRAKFLKSMARYEEAKGILEGIPSHFGDRVGWQYMPGKGISNEILDLEGRIKSQRRWQRKVFLLPTVPPAESGLRQVFDCSTELYNE